MCNSDGLNIIAHPQHRDNHGICSGNTGVVKIDKFLKGVYPMSNCFGVNHNRGNNVPVMNTMVISNQNTKMSHQNAVNYINTR